MDELLQTHSEILVPGLAFEAGSKASSIQERREVTVHPSGASEYKPHGGRTMRFIISDMAGWVQLNSIRFPCTVRAGHEFHPLGSLPNAVNATFKLSCLRDPISGLIEHYNRAHATVSL